MGAAPLGRGVVQGCVRSPAPKADDGVGLEDELDQRRAGFQEFLAEADRATPNVRMEKILRPKKSEHFECVGLPQVVIGEVDSDRGVIGSADLAVVLQDVRAALEARDDMLRGRRFGRGMVRSLRMSLSAARAIASAMFLSSQRCIMGSMINHLQ